MFSANYDPEAPLAIIHRGSPKEGEHPLSVLDKGMNAELVDSLIRRGVNPVITRGIGSFAVDGALTYLSSDYGYPRAFPVRVDLGKIGVIRDIAGSFKNGKDETVAMVERATTVINGSSVRRGDNKQFVADAGIFGERQVQTVSAEISDSAKAFKDLISGNFEGQNVVFAKPAEGSSSKGLYRIDLTRQLDDTIAQIIAENTGRKFVLQSYINNTLPLPSSIKPENEEQAALIEKYWNSPKELRLFWFYGKGRELTWLPTIKLTENLSPESPKLDTKRHYAFVDPDTVPAELVDFSGRALTDFANLCGVDEMSGALDFAFGTVGKETEPKWYVMEGNFWQPVPPTKKEHPVLRQKFVDATADQLSRIAHANKVKNRAVL